MTTEKVLENVFGTLSLVLLTAQLIPQVVHSYRRGSTEGLSISMMLLWFFGCLFQVPYFIYAEVSVPLIVQAVCFQFLTMVCIIQDCYYDNQGRWAGLFGKKRMKRSLDDSQAGFNAADIEERAGPSEDSIDTLSVVEEADLVTFQPTLHVRVKNSIITTALVALVWVCFEVGFYYWMVFTNSSALITTVGLMSTICTIIGFIPQYVVVLRNRNADGLSLFFLIMDCLGGLFGVLSLLMAEGSLDILATLIFASIATGELGLIVLYFAFRKNHVPK